MENTEFHHSTPTDKNVFELLVFSFQNASEQNTDNENTHIPPDSDPNFCILSAY